LTQGPSTCITVKKRLNITFATALLIAIFALLGLSLLANPALPVTGDQVRIVGWLHADGLRQDDAILVVELNGEHCLAAELHDNGQFFFTLPVGAKAKLTFAKPGHLPKEVEVDTRNARNTPKAERMNRKLEFEVILESEEQRPGLHYDGPVGAITFVNGTGTMKVRHDPRVQARTSGTFDQ
jgi:hypothetical protein